MCLKHLQQLQVKRLTTREKEREGEREREEEDVPETEVEAIHDRTPGML